MSIVNLNNNKTFDYEPNEIKVNRATNYKNNNLNYSTIARIKKNQIIYGTGVDDYVFNEIKKAKYQGCFDPGSLGNKNIFNDNNNIKSDRDNNAKLNNSNNPKKTFNKYKKYSSRIHKNDEGKNLLIAKSEIHYPLKFDKYHYLLSNQSQINKNDSLEYLINSSPITIKRNYHDKKRNKTNILTNNNYYTPIYDNKNDIEDDERYQNKTLAVSTLMNNYNENSKIMSKTRNIKNNKYSIDKNSGSNTLFNQKNIFNSPIIFPNRYSAFQIMNYYSKKRGKILTVNTSKTKKSNNFENFSNSKRDYISNMQNSELDLDNYENEIYDIDDDENKNYVLNKNNDDNDIKLIGVYRKKLLKLFIIHMETFYFKYFKNIFNEFISLLREKVKNQYNFENKTIIDIPEIKKNLITKSYYYGYNKQYENLLKDIKQRKNLKKAIQINNKKGIDLNEKDIKKDQRDLNDNKESKLVMNNNKINKNVEIEELDILDDVSNKKYIKKKVTAQGIFRNKNHQIKNNKKKIKIENVNFIKDYLTNQENRKTIKHSDKSEKLNMNKENDSTTITKNNNVMKPHPYKKAIINCLNKKNNNMIIQNKAKNNNISVHLVKKKYLINRQNENNNNLQVVDILEGKTDDEKLNMSMKYLEINSNNISPRNKNEINQNNLKIENVIEYTILGENNIDNNLEENNEEIETFENKNFQNTISLLTKIIENKEKDDKRKNILNSFLNIIIERKISKEKKYNYELLKKYFSLLKYTKNKEPSSKKKKKYSIDLIENRKINDDLLIENNSHKSYNEENNKTEGENVNLNIDQNNERDLSSNREKRKFRVVIKRIKLHRNITQNMSESRIKKLIPSKSAKNSLPILTDNNNNIITKKIKKKTISITVNRDMNNINISINKDKIKEIIGNKEEEKEVTQKENKDKEKTNKKEKSIDKDNNLNLFEDKINEENYIFTNSEKRLHRNFKLIKKSYLNQDKRKSLVNIPRIKKSIENFTKLRKSRHKLNKNNSGIFNNGDISQSEIYQDYENLIFYLRTQLIYFFITKHKYNESYND